MPRGKRPSVSRFREQAERLALTGRLDDALVLYRQIVELQPEVPEHRNRLADLLSRRAGKAEALAIWREKARMYEADGRLPRAVCVWRKIARRSPEDPESREHLATLLRRQGHHLGAMTAEADAAIIWARCGEVEAAFQLVEPLIDLLLAGGRPRAAALRLEQILACGQPHPRAQSKLEAAYRQMGGGRAR